MTRGAAIYGAGGHGRVVASILKARQVPVVGFFDDGCQPGATIGGVPVLGDRFDLTQKHRERITAVYLAIGDNLIRLQLLDVMRREGLPIPPLVHPRAWVEEGVWIGDGCVVAMGAMVATEASIGQACILNTGCCLEHEAVLGDAVHLAPRATVAGRTVIGEGAFVGMGAVVAQGLTIGKRVVIGANSVVLTDTPDGSKIVGVHHKQTRQA